MKIIDIINEVERADVKSYDKKYGKIKLRVDDTGTRIVHRYKGEFHRNDGKPAVVWNDGGKEWWVDGEVHNEDGPAVTDPDGTILWYLKGRKYTEREWEKKVKGKK